MLYQHISLSLTKPFSLSFWYVLIDAKVSGNSQGELSKGNSPVEKLTCQVRYETFSQMILRSTEMCFSKWSSIVLCQDIPSVKFECQRLNTVVVSVSWLYVCTCLTFLCLCNRWMTTMGRRSVIPIHGWKTLMVQKPWYVLMSCKELNLVLNQKIPTFHSSSFSLCISGFCWGAEQTDHAVPRAVLCPASVPPASHWAVWLPEIQLSLQKREEVLAEGYSLS